MQEGEDAAASEALQGSGGVRLGTDVVVQLAGAVRGGGRDSVQAECWVDPAANQLSLRKVGWTGVGWGLRCRCQSPRPYDSVFVGICAPCQC